MSVCFRGESLGGVIWGSAARMRGERALRREWRPGLWTGLRKTVLAARSAKGITRRVSASNIEPSINSL